MGIDMEKQFRHYLLAVAKTYARATGLALTSVARRFHGDEYFFDNFRLGKVSVTMRKADEMLKQFDKKWPDDTHWPTAKIKLTKPSDK